MEKAEFILAVKNIFNSCRNLSKLSGGVRKFTPDGRMVGDIGEVIASVFYRVNLHNVGRHDWDGVYNSKNVQIKATGGDSTYLREPPKDGFADGLLMVFKIDRESGKYELIYNGDIQRVWDALNSINTDRTGSKMISLNRLRKLQKFVYPENIIPVRQKMG